MQEGFIINLLNIIFLIPLLSFPNQAHKLKERK